MLIASCPNEAIQTGEALEQNIQSRGDRDITVVKTNRYGKMAWRKMRQFAGIM